ncbi:MAG TPA: ABC transporter substrate-binding protein, partial [Solirubrobacterales bacterium]|nr:ABC transporter substrate-binding protein [Solirubrobacterales bacterium]
MRWRFRGALIAAAAILVAAPGCGDDEEVGGGAADAGAALSDSGTLVYALDGTPRRLDPLLAATRAEQLVTRQAHEPLVDSLHGPFGPARRERGLARSWRPSRDREIWSFELRRRVRFQDGTPFDAAAVLVNAERWQESAQGRALLPELSAADAPRPDLVRFILTRPVSDLPRRLASPRLGIVSPATLRRGGRGVGGLAGMARSGTGAFELRERERGKIVVARNVGWWGSRAGLGPALDQVVFRVAPSARERLLLLRGGTVQVADSLPPAARRRIRRDPLLTYVTGAGGRVLGLERSVRGIDSATAVEPLSDVWVTRVGIG